MLSPAFVMLIIFGTIFGIAYLYFSTRHKERMSLIEKGADASIFFNKGNQKAAPVWKILVLNLSLLLMGIGAGIVLGGILYANFDVYQEIAMPGAIFLMAGTGLLVGFFLTKNIDK